MRTYLECEENEKIKFLEEILRISDISHQTYKDVLKVSDRVKQIILIWKPNECYINNYNLRLIIAYQANIDLQFCMDAYAVVTYVCDYWSKDETGMTDFLKQALKESKHFGNFERLSHLKRTFMCKRQIWKSEAVYRAIPSMHLQESSISCTCVQSGYPEKQSKYLRKVNLPENLESKKWFYLRVWYPRWHWWGWLKLFSNSRNV